MEFCLWMGLEEVMGRDLELDLRGYQCPLPVLKARNQLRKMNAGEQVWVHTDDPLAILDIPHFCSQYGQELVTQAAGRGDEYRFLIKRCGNKL